MSTNDINSVLMEIKTLSSKTDVQFASLSARFDDWEKKLNDLSSSLETIQKDIDKNKYDVASINWKINALEQMDLDYYFELSGFSIFQNNNQVNEIVRSLINKLAIPIDISDFRSIYHLNYRSGQGAKIVCRVFNLKTKYLLQTSLKLLRASDKPLTVGQLGTIPTTLYVDGKPPKWASNKIGIWDRLTKQTKTILEIAKETEGVEYAYVKEGKVLIKTININKHLVISDPEDIKKAINSMST
jgi:hypothetical protein